MSKRTACLGASWFVVGAAVGTAVSLLYAPRSGRKTRHLLRREADHGIEYLSIACDDISREGRRILDRGKELLDAAA